MTFQATKCDECGALKGENDRWQQFQVWTSTNAGTVAIGLGKLGDLLELTRTAPPIESVSVDLCGQACALKHIAKLLGWSS